MHIQDNDDDDDDANWFRDEFAGVEPLKPTGKAGIVKSPANQELLQRQKSYARAAAVTNEAGSDLDGLEVEVGFGPETVSDDYIEWVEPDAVLSFKRTGIQDGVFKKLRLGKYPIDGRLDLHRKTVTEAREQVLSFIREAMHYDSRTLIIVHGKGELNPRQPATLKSFVAKWLKEISPVMAYHSAQRQHGGSGAVYVMLKKSEKMKEKARESHGHKN